jgi:ATP-dependent Lon protease
MIQRKLPLLPVKDLVAFPNIFTPIFVGRDLSKNAVNEGTNSYNSEILIVQQKDKNLENPMYLSDFYQVGVLCKIIRYEKSNVNQNTYKLLVQGLKRVKISNLVVSDSKVLEANFDVLPNVEFDIVNSQENKSFYENLVKDLVNIIEKGFVSDGLIPVKELRNPIATCYLLLYITKDALENQKILECEDGVEIIKKTYDEILKQKNQIEVRESIAEQAKENMTKSQKEYFLKEQMRAIKKELGEDNESDLESYLKKFKEIENCLSESNKKEIQKNLKKLKNASSESYEVSVIKNYLDYVFELPWNIESEEKLDISKAKTLLNKKHSYLDEVKERILEFLSVKKLNPDSKAPIICFQGPPGVGKTSFAQTIAQSIGRESVRISLGGVRDESEIRGHRKTYVGAMPGKIIQGIRQAGKKNPVVILDEIDKLSNDFRGDPSSALLEVLDPEQNNTFKDHYINLEFDLSKVMFIATSNNLDTIPGPLRDRLEVIKIPGYSEEEKLEIAKKFIIPKKVKEGGLRDTDVSFSSLAVRDIIRNYTKEFGVRELERQIFKVVRKIAKKKAEGNLKSSCSVSNKNLKQYLGSAIFSSSEDNKNGLGVVTGLAWTSYGGAILKLESILLEEPGDIILTGSLGDVMKESAKIGFSVIKDNAKKWGIPPENLSKKRVHLHFPDGATPKDGPSAGIALVSSMVSLLSNKKVKNSIAMTGEISLTGKVWPVGGIREKVLAAVRSGIKLVIIPKENKKDFESIPEELTKKIQVKYVSNVSEVIKEIF